MIFPFFINLISLINFLFFLYVVTRFRLIIIIIDIRGIKPKQCSIIYFASAITSTIEMTSEYKIQFYVLDNKLVN
jgi:hypothetical protein